MRDVNNNNFGAMITCLVPGATTLLGLSVYSQTIRELLHPTCETAPTIGGFLHLTAVAVAVGMTVGAVRWATVDKLHAMTGITPPSLNFRALEQHVAGMQLLIEIHYRYYLFYSNQLVATLFAYVCFRTKFHALMTWARAEPI